MSEIKLEKAFTDKKIGLALSGGGYRAAVFHLGMLSYMAENNLLEKVAHISTVSGGSIAMGLIYRFNSFKWPTSKEYLENVHEEVITFLQKHSLLEDNMTTTLVKSAATNGLLALNKKMLRRLQGKTWGLDKDIQELDDHPKWTINATTGDTGKSWRFDKEKMGDHVIGYMKNPNISLAKTISASAGFPVVIGPLRLMLNKYGYKTKEKYDPGEKSFPRETVTLYDGGLYDNLGTEVFFDRNATRLSKSVDFLVVSDASKPFDMKKDMFTLWQFGKFNQISDISTEQIRSLRLRMFRNLAYRKDEPDLGLHIGIGQTELDMEDEAKCAKRIATDLKALSKREINCLINNGFDAASKNFEKYMKDVDEYNAIGETDETV